MGIRELYQQYLKGQPGEGAVLLHNHQHESPLCESLCVLGASRGCPTPVNCSSLYSCGKNPYCLETNEPVKGLLVHEEKHRKLVERRALGAYPSIQKALDAEA